MMTAIVMNPVPARMIGTKFDAMIMRAAATAIRTATIRKVLEVVPGCQKVMSGSDHTMR